MNNKINLYSHYGSTNHGCEAIVRSTIKALGEERNISLYSMNPSDDRKYNLHEKIQIVDGQNTANGLIYKLKYKLLKDDMIYYKAIYKEFLKSIKENEIYFSIGGDNYCYKNSRWLQLLNKEINANNAKTVLWGCSINEDELNETLVNDLNRYMLITAREHLTIKYLRKYGVKTRIEYIPDTAFILDKDMSKIPMEMESEKEFIGINVSPVVVENAERKELVYRNYYKLIKYLIENTDYYITLIPHVVINGNDDRELLNKLYTDFEKNPRIILIDDYNCEQLKGIISRCVAFIGARTHSTIAAYSSCVPTLVVGYSVKAKGIAEDLFGTTENYVIPTQELRTEDQLTKGMQWIIDNKDEIKTHLEEIMPEYKNQVYKVRDILEEMGI